MKVPSRSVRTASSIQRQWTRLFDWSQLVPLKRVSMPPQFSKVYRGMAGRALVRVRVRVRVRGRVRGKGRGRGKGEV